MAMLLNIESAMVEGCVFCKRKVPTRGHQWFHVARAEHKQVLPAPIRIEQEGELSWKVSVGKE